MIVPMILDPVGTTGDYVRRYTNVFGHTDGYTKGYMINDPDLQDDSLTYKVLLSAGTHTLRTVFARQTNGGNIKVYLDAAEIHTFDARGTGAANHVNTKTGIVVASNGYYDLKYEVFGTTGTRHIFLIHSFAMWRTA